MPTQLIARMAGRPRTETDSDLLRRFARDRDEAAFEELLCRHGPAVWGVCRRRAADAQAAEDAFQATFLALVIQAKSVRGDSLAGWLYRVAVRAAGRARPTRGEPCPDVIDARPATSAESREAAGLIDAAVAGLPAVLREAFVLRLVEGLSSREAAARLGRPVATVDSRLHRARKRLADSLTKRGVTPAVPAAAAVPAALAERAARVAGLSLGGAEVGGSVAALAGHVAAPAVSLKAWLAGALLLATAVGAVAVAPPEKKDSPRAAVKPAGPPLPAGALRRLGRAKFYSPTFMTAVAASPDGVHVAGLTYIGTVRVWEYESGKEVLHHAPKKGGFGFDQVLGFTPDGRGVLYTTRRPGRLYRVDIATGRRVKACDIPAPAVRQPGVRLLSADSTRLAVQVGDLLEVYSAADGKCVMSLAVDRDMWQAVRLGSGWLALIDKASRRARIIDTATGKTRHTLPCAFAAVGQRDDFVSPIDFSPDGRRAVVNTPGKGMKIYDLRTGNPVTNVAAGGRVDIRYSREGDVFVVVTYAEGGRVYDAKTGRLISRVVAWQAPDNKDGKVCWLPGGRTIIQQVGNSIAAYDAVTGLTARHGGTPGKLQTLRFGPRGRVLTGVTTRSRRLWRWDAKTGEVLTREAAPPDWRPLMEVAAPKVSKLHPGCEAITAVGDNLFGEPWLIGPVYKKKSAEVYLYEPDTMKLVRRATLEGDFLKGGERLLHVTSHGPDFAWLAGWVGGGRVGLWDARTGKLRSVMRAGGMLFRTVASPSGRLIALGASEPPQPDRDFEGVTVYDTRTGNKVAGLKGAADPTCVAISPDDRLAAVGDRGGPLRVFEIKSGKCLKAYRGHDGAVTALAFSPDGKVLAAASADAPVFLWPAR